MEGPREAGRDILSLFFRIYAILFIRQEIPTGFYHYNRMKTRFRCKASECAICYNFIETQGRIDSCDHAFCFNCILKWSKMENT